MLTADRRLLVFPLVATFCNVAFLAMVEAHLRGEPVDWRAGLRVAWSRLPAILAWSAFAATIGLLIRLVDRLPGGQLVTGLLQLVLGLAWAAATMFVTPLLVLHPDRPHRMLVESASVLRRRFGASVVGSASIAVVGLVALIPCGAFACAGFAAVDDGTQLGWILIVAGVAGAVAAIMLMEATAEVFHLVLYRHAGERRGGRGLHRGRARARHGEAR